MSSYEAPVWASASSEFDNRIVDGISGHLAAQAEHAPNREAADMFNDAANYFVQAAHRRGHRSGYLAAETAYNIVAEHAADTMDAKLLGMALPHAEPFTQLHILSNLGIFMTVNDEGSPALQEQWDHHWLRLEGDDTLINDPDNGAIFSLELDNTAFVINLASQYVGEAKARAQDDAALVEDIDRRKHALAAQAAQQLDDNVQILGNSVSTDTIRRIRDEQLYIAARFGVSVPKNSSEIIGCDILRAAHNTLEKDELEAYITISADEHQPLAKRLEADAILIAAGLDQSSSQFSKNVLEMHDPNFGYDLANSLRQVLPKIWHEILRNKHDSHMDTPDDIDDLVAADVSGLPQRLAKDYSQACADNSEDGKALWMSLKLGQVYADNTPGAFENSSEQVMFEAQAQKFIAGLEQTSGLLDKEPLDITIATVEALLETRAKLSLNDTPQSIATLIDVFSAVHAKVDPREYPAQTMLTELVAQIETDIRILQNRASCEYDLARLMPLITEWTPLAKKYTSMHTLKSWKQQGLNLPPRAQRPNRHSNPRRQWHR